MVPGASCKRPARRGDLHEGVFVHLQITRFCNKRQSSVCQVRLP